MSKLPNAPLLEVIFELRWKITNQEDLSKSQYLHGDLYAALKDSYPLRESLVSPLIPGEVLINRPSHRFRKETNGYPLFQVGPGLITLNTIDIKYEWNEYFGWCQQLLNNFFKSYPAAKGEKFKPVLMYYDFFRVDPIKNNLLEYINNNFNINNEQKFYKTENFPKTFNWGVNYGTDIGDLSVSINTGKNSKQEEGLILHTQLRGLDFGSESKDLFDWLDKAHEFCSDLFKKMIKKRLYDSFK